ncbi:hypothetical protein BP5796_10160 [Coleophoma crateriformis]|uniref:J domain-containing protein n=1 Tax=Coleophoma crateriformis TaxID=565419 RepID=A0A3D8QUU4_9HELO|nr:hypothetical protein BP5796_10160 [Coleophoma crateriformis]
MTSEADSGPDLVQTVEGDDSKNDEYVIPQTSKFRFKKSSKRRSHRSEEPQGSSHEWDGERERHHRHHHRHKRRKTTSSRQPDDPSLYDDTYLPNASSKEYVDPDVAFRESLFDAMADDEGAQYWEGVYGQPIHTYPNVKEGPKGELERMTDDEYTQYVRAKMFEKTHQHLLEEKARRDEARAKAKEENERYAREGREEREKAAKFRSQVEESLRRGEQRKSRKAWSEKWEQYVQSWEKLGKGASKVAIASIPWPVESGKRKDIKLEEIERFFLNAPSGGQPTETQLSKILKLERVRWHPDKIQQKLGGQDVDETVMQAVTAVFQAIDRMWSDMRDRK